MYTGNAGGDVRMEIPTDRENWAEDRKAKKVSADINSNLLKVVLIIDVYGRNVTTPWKRDNAFPAGIVHSDNSLLLLIPKKAYSNWGRRRQLLQRE